MYALRNEEGSFARRHTGNSVEWRGVTYSNLAAMTDAERVDGGIYRLFYPERRPTDYEIGTGFVYVFDDAVGTCREEFVIEPLPLTEAQSKLIDQAKATAASLLQPTDWKITRAAEGGQPCSPETLAYRAAVRAACNAYEAWALATASVADLPGISPAWPPLA